MMHALYEAILEDERILEEAFKYEVLTRQAEASGDQELMEFSRRMCDESRRRAERAERLLARRLPEKTILRTSKEERQGATQGQELGPRR